MGLFHRGSLTGSCLAAFWTSGGRACRTLPCGSIAFFGYGAPPLGPTKTHATDNANVRFAPEYGHNAAEKGSGLRAKYKKISIYDLSAGASPMTSLCKESGTT